MNLILKKNKFVQSFHKLKKKKHQTTGYENVLHLINQGIQHLIV